MGRPSGRWKLRGRGCRPPSTGSGHATSTITAVIGLLYFILVSGDTLVCGSQDAHRAGKPATRRRYLRSGAAARAEATATVWVATRVSQRPGRRRCARLAKARVDSFCADRCCRCYGSARNGRQHRCRRRANRDRNCRRAHTFAGRMGCASAGGGAAGGEGNVVIAPGNGVQVLRCDQARRLSERGRRPGSSGAGKPFRGSVLWCDLRFPSKTCQQGQALMLGWDGHMPVCQAAGGRSFPLATHC